MGLKRVFMYSLGILDDWFNIECGQVTMPAEIFEKKNDLKHTLNSDDRIYKLIRDDHIQKSGESNSYHPIRSVIFNTIFLQ